MRVKALVNPEKTLELVPKEYSPIKGSFSGY
jgi:hypothetical protein